MCRSGGLANRVTGRASRALPRSSSTHRPRRSTSGVRVLPEGNDSRAIYPSLRGKRVLVTGGGSGIGAGIVEAFAAQGCEVTFIDILNGPSEAHAAKTGATFRRVDLREVGKTRQAIDEIVAERGPFDVLVNNAANDDRHSIDEITEDYWDDRLNVNLKHHF